MTCLRCYTPVPPSSWRAVTQTSDFYPRLAVGVWVDRRLHGLADVRTPSAGIRLLFWARGLDRMVCRMNGSQDQICLSKNPKLISTSFSTRAKTASSKLIPALCQNGTSIAPKYQSNTPHTRACTNHTKIMPRYWLAGLPAWHRLALDVVFVVRRDCLFMLSFDGELHGFRLKSLSDHSCFTRCNLV